MLSLSGPGSPRTALALLLAVATCGTMGCRDPEPPGAVMAVEIAVGAEVTLSFAELCAHGEAGVCASDPPDALQIDSLSGSAFEPLESGAVDSIRVRALQPGYSRISMRFLDRRGDSQQERVWLHAAAITDVAVRLLCDDGSWDEAEGLAVAIGAGFSFDAQALNGETELLSGDLTLIETADGFALDDGRASAPSSPGTYLWSVASGESISIVVYTPGELQLSVRERPRAGETYIDLEPVVGATAVCVHGAEARATLTVTGGSCRPLLASGVEIEGALPLSLEGGRLSLRIVGDGACTLETSVDGGAPMSQSVDVTPEPLADPPTRGAPLDPSAGAIPFGGGLPSGSACNPGGTDGDCDTTERAWLFPTDFDCYLDSFWKTGHTDGTLERDAELSEESFIGVGLTSELRLEIRAAPFGLFDILEFGPPETFRWMSTPADGVSLESVGCRPDDGSFEAFRLEALVEGRHEIGLRADNVSDDGTFVFTARTVARAVYDFDGVIDDVVQVFTGAQIDLSVSYESTDGTVLRGVAPVLVAGDDAAAGSRAWQGGLYTGITPNLITVSSPPATNARMVQVVELGALAVVNGLSDAAVSRESVRCASFAPASIDGTPILGSAPSRPRVTLDGSAFTVSLAPAAGSTCDAPCLCLVGAAPGTTSVSVAWSAASAMAEWSVPAP